MFANPAEPDCPHGIAQNHLLVKQETRGLANAIVILARKDVRVMPTRLAVGLSAVGCQLLPRVHAVAQGTSLILAGKAPASHTLRTMRKSDRIFEVKIGPGISPIRRPLVV